MPRPYASCARALDESVCSSCKRSVRRTVRRARGNRPAEEGERVRGVPGQEVQEQRAASPPVGGATRARPQVENVRGSHGKKGVWFPGKSWFLGKFGPPIDFRS